ncbi:hypothetical protein CO054_02240 [Candidatus Shapirobacteria bacterium CG_4_9_14_0_2_um_filter_39_11]|uniref:Uncharacterized protein n=1 Tax=Candidatus Shapirobacteria bacterium CG_4_9_14_0_2_um_filter_39_11 TaxID=1974478 RepID=A0A2M8ESE3_9BACT|nr:MAG: hypothetical protein CO054_02240 [Candidatus Shapirobacteria bacterium CG_4_9_14_0_2_um_filter_39_11]
MCPPAAPPLIFCSRNFWELRSFIIPQNESAKMVEIGRFQIQSFRFHHNFGLRQAKRKNEARPESFPAVPADFSFSTPSQILYYCTKVQE